MFPFSHNMFQRSKSFTTSSLFRKKLHVEKTFFCLFIRATMADTTWVGISATTGIVIVVGTSGVFVMNVISIALSRWDRWRERRGPRKGGRGAGDGAGGGDQRQGPGEQGHHPEGQGRRAGRKVPPPRGAVNGKTCGRWPPPR